MSRGTAKLPEVPVEKRTAVMLPLAYTAVMRYWLLIIRRRRYRLCRRTFPRPRMLPRLPLQCLLPRRRSLWSRPRRSRRARAPFRTSSSMSHESSDSWSSQQQSQGSFTCLRLKSFSRSRMIPAAATMEPVMMRAKLKGAASLFAVFLALFHLYLSFMS